MRKNLQIGIVGLIGGGVGALAVGSLFYGESPVSTSGTSHSLAAPPALSQPPIAQAIGTKRMPLEPATRADSACSLTSQAEAICKRTTQNSEEDITDLQNLYARLATEPGTLDARKNILEAFSKMQDGGRADALIRTAILLEKDTSEGEVARSYAEWCLHTVWQKNPGLRDSARADLLVESTSLTLRRSLLSALVRSPYPEIGADMSALYFSSNAEALRTNALFHCCQFGRPEEAYAPIEDALKRHRGTSSYAAEPNAAVYALEQLGQRLPTERRRIAEMLVGVVEDPNVYRSTFIRAAVNLRDWAPDLVDKLPAGARDRVLGAKRSIPPVASPSSK